MTNPKQNNKNTFLDTFEEKLILFIDDQTIIWLKKNIYQRYKSTPPLLSYRTAHTWGKDGLVK